MTTSTHAMIQTCACCGLIQRIPTIQRSSRLCCARCATRMRQVRGRTPNVRSAAIALGALILYPLAVSLPVMTVTRFGQSHAASILSGTVELLAEGEWVVGSVVLICSIILPIGKLLAMLMLSTGATRLRAHHRALTYRIVEWTGRWGMLDVLLIATLVAVLKIGDLVDVTPGPGATAFAACVILSLLAAACFDPHSLWNDEQGVAG